MRLREDICLDIRRFTNKIIIIKVKVVKCPPVTVGVFAGCLCYWRHTRQFGRDGACPVQGMTPFMPSLLPSNSLFPLTHQTCHKTTTSDLSESGLVY